MNLLERPICEGFLTGMILQLAIGPVFFYLLGITMASGFFSGLSGVAAVTAADYLYIALSILGIGKLLENEKSKRIFSIGSSIILVGFGVQFLFSAVSSESAHIGSAVQSWTPVTSFVSCFLLTISSPLTILFWGSMFSAKATEHQYDKSQLVSFAIGAGLSTLTFLTLAMFVLSLFRTAIPNWAIEVLNILVGVVLLAYGITRTVKTILRKEGPKAV